LSRPGSSAGLVGINLRCHVCHGSGMNVPRTSQTQVIMSVQPTEGARAAPHPRRYVGGPIRQARLRTNISRAPCSWCNAQIGAGWPYRASRGRGKRGEEGRSHQGKLRYLQVFFLSLSFFLFLGGFLLSFPSLPFGSSSRPSFLPLSLPRQTMSWLSPPTKRTAPTRK
jgi:hypothetical protein